MCKLFRLIKEGPWLWETSTATLIGKNLKGERTGLDILGFYWCPFYATACYGSNILDF